MGSSKSPCCAITRTRRHARARSPGPRGKTNAEGGADIIDAAVNGLGERAQIAPLAEIASVIQIYYGIDCGIKLDKMAELSQLVADLTKIPLSDTMPLVGKTGFSQHTEMGQ